jgi:hypothetical protein
VTAIEQIAQRFQGAMMENDWLCDSTVGHEVGTCLGCITVALNAAGVPALLDVAEAAQEWDRTWRPTLATNCTGGHALAQWQLHEALTQLNHRAFPQVHPNG